VRIYITSTSPSTTIFEASGQSPLPGQRLPQLRIPGSTFVLTFTGSSDSFNAATTKRDNLFGLALLVTPIMRIDENEYGNAENISNISNITNITNIAHIAHRGTKTQFLSNFAGDQGGGLFMVGATGYGRIINTGTLLSLWVLIFPPLSKSVF
jgi:hypothetical protein